MEMMLFHINITNAHLAGGCGLPPGVKDQASPSLAESAVSTNVPPPSGRCARRSRATSAGTPCSFVAERVFACIPHKVRVLMCCGVPLLVTVAVLYFGAHIAMCSQSR
jgi:hypothetical protein